MRLLFGFAEDYCLNFEDDVAALSEKYQEVIEAPNDQSPDPSLFLQAFQRLWIAMEDQVLAEFPSDAVDEGAAIAADASRQGAAAGHSDTLVDLKKAILLRSSQSRAPLAELKNVEHSFDNGKDVSARPGQPDGASRSDRRRRRSEWLRQDDAVARDRG